MRAVISLLITGLLLSCMAINSQTVTNSLFDMLQSTSGSQQLISAKSKPPKSPYRGSGRGRELLLSSSKGNTPKNRPARGGERRELKQQFSDARVV
jgi:hypothetical protein